jgi:hypothetical protein
MSDIIEFIVPDSGEIREVDRSAKSIIESVTRALPSTYNSSIVYSGTYTVPSKYETQLLKRTAYFKKRQAQCLINLILEQDFEYGFLSSADKYTQDVITRYPSDTKELLNDLFIIHYGDTRIVIGILQIISHIDYMLISPNGPTMALAALAHRDPEVRECGIRAFENWNSAESLKVLRNTHCQEKWLQNYLEEVVANLEQELSINDASC